MYAIYYRSSAIKLVVSNIESAKTVANYLVYCFSNLDLVLYNIAFHIATTTNNVNGVFFTSIKGVGNVGFSNRGIKVRFSSFLSCFSFNHLYFFAPQAFLEVSVRG